MASTGHVCDSEDSANELEHTPEAEENMMRDVENSQPQSTLSHRFRDSPTNGPEPKENHALSVMVPAPARPWEYQPFQGATIVDSVLEEVQGPAGTTWYKIEFETGEKETVSLEKLIQFRNGRNALNIFHDGSDPGASNSKQDDDTQPNDDPKMNSLVSKRSRTKPLNSGFVDSSALSLDSEEDLSGDQAVLKKRRLEQGGVSLLTSNSKGHSSRHSSRLNSRPASSAIPDEESSESESGNPRPSRTRTMRRITRSVNPKPASIKLNVNKTFQSDDEDELAGPVHNQSDEGSDIVYIQSDRSKGKKARASQSQPKRGRGRPHMARNPSSSPDRPEPSRRSGRERVMKNMKERDMDEEIYADEGPAKNTPKVISIREIYQPIPETAPFYLLHNSTCDVCSGVGTSSNKGTSPLIHCQGCSTSIHKVCLGYRSGRDHLVTKVSHENFVLQCRRCIGIAVKKDALAPHLDICQECKKPGLACKAFASRKTSKQEERLREENYGNDPITEVSENLINNAENVLFRCISCHRAFHFEHLPALNQARKTDNNLKICEIRDQRLQEYTPRWECKECCTAPTKVQTLVAWRPADRELYVEGETIEQLNEDHREYLIKWDKMSYFKCTWMPGAWVWGVTAATMRKAFVNRDEGVNDLPKWTNKQAIPEEYLRMEIIFDAQYDGGFEPESKAADEASINMVKQVLVKFQGLGYDEAVWEEPPTPTEEARWSAFVSAYNEYVAGRYLKQPPATDMKERLDAFRSRNFEKKVELKKQPTALTGGQLMPYQMEGLNWLLYNFHQKKNVILADEMGLGKTIQIIAFIASLAKDNPKCWPFLVVTPNSTCPNWRREIKKWAPSLRVVAYYGAKKARDMAMEYELYPDGCSDLRAHVVVTSYEAPVDDHSRSFFRRIKWAGMIVDEGQRLKNDANLLYVALKALKIPFQVLLTGTPLQNNKRELFNLLQFLDTSINAAEMDEKYTELTKENLPELHELIRPFFLRRTKLQVLKFLPPMAQVILPVSMSVVQKKLYKSILARSPELIKSILGQNSTVLKPKERGNLNNILMQLRKCLCHPFLYSTAIEEISETDTEEDVQRKLVEASSKFQLLKIMLPKLRDRGHRILLFSQFLNQLDLVEDLLSGLGLPFQRLDGTIGSLEKQRRIDAFNAPDSELFAFLLSTRAGGVGINLATADTVIIMDPDFNPHQDIQALSRAHRLGQKKKVLVFQLMTKDSAEEKIVQIGRKKMALDQALIESMGAEDDAGVDLESILRHGAQALFADDDRNDIRYDSASVDKLLDRTQVENTDTNDDKTAESQFSFARVWANDKGILTNDADDDDDNDNDAPLDTSLWDKILKQREADAAAEAARDAKTFGRGKRTRQIVVYGPKSNVDLDDDPSPMKQPSKRRPSQSASDLDFHSAHESDGDEESDSSPVNLHELTTQTGSKGNSAKGTIRKFRNSVKGKAFVKPVSISGVRAAGTLTLLHSLPVKKTQVSKQMLPAATIVATKARPVAKDSLSLSLNQSVAIAEQAKSGLRPVPPKKIQNAGARPPDFSIVSKANVTGYQAVRSSQVAKASQYVSNSNSRQSRALQDRTDQQLRGPFPPSSQQPGLAQISNIKVTHPQSTHFQDTPGYVSFTATVHESAPRTGTSKYPPTAYSVVPGFFPDRGEYSRSFDQTHGQPRITNAPDVSTKVGKPQRPNFDQCPRCRKRHPLGQCSLQAQASEECGFCGIPHSGFSRKCPCLCSEAQIRLMLDALPQSGEPRYRITAIEAALRSEIASRNARKSRF
ncbi:SNF2 family domain-containing protein [Diplocarpon rosae]|nr:SNF2 family domain-containing protein [Diplocarpon rosae]